jgi:hypothetical protein
MMAMVQRLDARSFLFDSHLSVFTFLALILKVCRYRFGCHGPSVAELSPSKLYNFGHSVTIDGLQRIHSNLAGELDPAIVSNCEQARPRKRFIVSLSENPDRSRERPSFCRFPGLDSTEAERPSGESSFLFPLIDFLLISCGNGVQTKGRCTC